MSATGQYVKLAKALPPRLKKFIARYPPQTLLQAGTSLNPSTSTTSSTNQLPSDPTNLSSPATSNDYYTVSQSPFQPFRHPITGKWHNPVFSLKRQAELVKMARQHGVEELLPQGVKSTEERIRKRAEHGLRVRGTGVGQKVKGKYSERTMRTRLHKRKEAMLQMPKTIQTWKERGHGRGWKKWPKPSASS